MADVQTNLRVPKRSSRRPEAGDIFAMRPKDDTYIFGRVVGAELDHPYAPMPGSYLIYVYAHRSPTMDPTSEELSPRRLLLPPVFINRMPWTKGYFENVRQEGVKDTDLLAQHCFWDAARGRFCDEQQRQLTAEVQPCGDWALSSYRRLDDQVSDALGIRRVPED